MASVGAQIAKRDFSAKTLRALCAKGVELVSVQALPGSGGMAWANAERGYVVNDGGCGRVLSFSQVLEAAK